nr:STM4014 family protein [Nocardiopsis algeriensis]
MVVVGVPGNRRLELFGAAAAAAGWPEPAVVPWRDLASGPVELPRGALVRVDSPGGDAETERLLRGWKKLPDLYRAEGTGAQHAGFRAALARLEEAARDAEALLLQRPGDLVAMCDKRLCHARLAGAGVPVPAALPGPVESYAGLREAMREHRLPRVFVKPAHGSSASGVIALATASGGRVRAVTSAELVRGDDGSAALYNSLRLRTYTSEADVAAVVDALAPDGLHVEQWLPKAGFAGRTVDLRVVVTAGQATHVVVRSSSSPLTNLHLGNARGDAEALREAVGPAAWAEAMRTAEDAAACFDTLHAGVDLLALPGWHTFAVCEVNAFGDLLPGVLHEGRDTYAEQLHALSRDLPAGRRPRSAAEDPRTHRHTAPAGATFREGP